jgi:hypothetical protein
LRAACPDCIISSFISPEVMFNEDY